jgi:hypothetical protein
MDTSFVGHGLHGAARREPRNVAEVYGVWAPGVVLMRNLPFSGKALIISAIFFLAVFTPGYLFVSDQLASMRFSQQERVGVQLLQRFTPVLQGLLTTRTATRAMLGKFDAAARYTAARVQTDQAIAGFDDLLRSSGDVLGVQPEFGLTPFARTH